MRRATTFQSNLTALEKINPKLTHQIVLCDPSPLEFCYTDRGELNLKRIYDGHAYFYHSPSDAQSEARTWFNQIQPSETLFVYGIGLGYYFEAVKEWLNTNTTHTLVFLEEDLGVLHRFLETELAGTILAHPQVRLLYFANLKEDQALFGDVAWTYISGVFVISYLKLYEEVNLKGCQALSHEITRAIVQTRAFAEEYWQYGIAFFRNYYPNLLELDKAYLGNALFGQFQDVPAIICGAGPSLEKNFDVLQSLQERALIFAGSSALPALMSKGLLPHFGAAIDPNNAQVGRVQTAHTIPFFYRNRLCHEALNSITGPRLYVTGSGGYEIASWFDSQLGLEEEEVDEGHNIVNFCIEIAHALGCRPIILVGVDLALTGEQHYAKEVISTLHLSADDLKIADDVDSQPVTVQDIYGNPTKTFWKWITEAEWIAQFAEAHPATTLINCTEGGIGFKGVANQSLATVAADYLKHRDNYTDRIKQQLEKLALKDRGIALPKIVQLMRDFQASLRRCLLHFETLMQEMRILSSRSEENIKELATPLTLLTESDLEDEAGYKFLLETFNAVYIKSHQKKIEAVQRMPQPKSEKIELHVARLQFLSDVAHLNSELIDWTLR